MSMTDEFSGLESLYEQGSQGAWQAIGNEIVVVANGQRYVIARFASATDAAYVAASRGLIARAIAELRQARSAAMTGWDNGRG